MKSNPNCIEKRGQSNDRVALFCLHRSSFGGVSILETEMFRGRGVFLRVEGDITVAF